MSFFSRMNATVRGFAIILVIALVIFLLQLQATLVAVYVLASLALLLAMVFFVYLVWREHRSDIATWPARAKVVMYGGPLLIVVDLVWAWLFGARGADLVAFLAVIVLCGFAMFRVWRDQHTYGI
jgi:hypothetical protein